MGKAKELVQCSSEIIALHLNSIVDVIESNTIS